jgi:hypothetical protein
MDRTQHLADLRAASAYPLYRGLVRLFTSVTLLLAFLMLVGGWWAAATLGQTIAGVAGVVLAGLLALWAFVLREVLLMVADRTDATLQLASRAARPGEQ